MKRLLLATSGVALLTGLLAKDAEAQARMEPSRASEVHTGWTGEVQGVGVRSKAFVDGGRLLRIQTVAGTEVHAVLDCPPPNELYFDEDAPSGSDPLGAGEVRVAETGEGKWTVSSRSSTYAGDTHTAVLRCKGDEDEEEITLENTATAGSSPPPGPNPKLPFTANETLLEGSLALNLQAAAEDGLFELDEGRLEPGVGGTVEFGFRPIRSAGAWVRYRLASVAEQIQELSGVMSISHTVQHCVSAVAGWLPGNKSVRAVLRAGGGFCAYPDDEQEPTRELPDGTRTEAVEVKREFDPMLQAEGGVRFGDTDDGWHIDVTLGGAVGKMAVTNEATLNLGVGNTW